MSNSNNRLSTTPATNPEPCPRQVMEIWRQGVAAAPAWRWDQGFERPILGAESGAILESFEERFRRASNRLGHLGFYGSRVAQVGTITANGRPILRRVMSRWTPGTFVWEIFSPEEGERRYRAQVDAQRRHHQEVELGIRSLVHTIQEEMSPGDKPGAKVPGYTYHPGPKGGTYTANTGIGTRLPAARAFALAVDRHGRYRDAAIEAGFDRALYNARW